MKASLQLMPRFTYAHETADQLLLDMNIDSLPINPDAVLKDIGCKIYTYREFAHRHHITIRDAIDYLGSADGCTFYRPRTGQYIIFVNDVDPSTKRIRWTMTHELSHIILRHLENNTAKDIENAHPFARLSIEREADACASELLGPNAVLYRIGCTTAEVISKTCDISYQAAANKERFFSRCRGYQYNRTELRLLSQFSDYMNKNVIA